MQRCKLALSRTIVIMAGALGAFVAPAHAQNCTPFTDVLASDPFCVNIQWMYARAITLGCTANQYCPTQFVRRDQMAAFMNRLGDIVYQDGGNAFGGPAVLGTTDNHPLDVIVNGVRAMRYEPNAISPNVIGGHPANNVTAGVRGATIAGGGVPTGNTDPNFTGQAPNRVTDAYGTVGGGYDNVAGNDTGSTVDAPFGTVGGGLRNLASGFGSTVSGGYLNNAGGTYSTVAGGSGNTPSGSSSTIAGGGSNIASGTSSVVAGGSTNTASGAVSTVAGGASNIASGNFSIVAGGQQNTASGHASTVAGGQSNAASGTYSTVAGGFFNAAGGTSSFAAGFYAKANFHGCFVYADNTNSNPTSCFAQNEIVIRGRGGFYFWTAGTSDATYSGARLAPGTGAWAAYSDRRGKHQIDPVDAGAVLDKLVAMPIATWQWTSEPGAIRHMGPMAQDFHAAFGLGDSDTQIVTVDADGVALAAIQGLNAKVDATIKARDATIAMQARELVAQRERHDAELAAVRREIAHLREQAQGELAALRHTVEVLLARTTGDARLAQAH